MRAALIETVQIFKDALSDPVSSSITHFKVMFQDYFANIIRPIPCFKQIWAHKAILKARCQHFQLMLHPR